MPDAPGARVLGPARQEDRFGPGEEKDLAHGPCAGSFVDLGAAQLVHHLFETSDSDEVTKPT